jgi:aspartyl-tRNA(Asn)/glutamyl-tRNA(Gln) amidotransferase subunit C
MLSKEEVKHIAMLARIGVSEDEVESYQQTLSAVLDSFKELQNLDTEEIASIGHITGRTGEARIDRDESFGTEGEKAIQENFPDSEKSFLKVKSVF